MELKMKIYTLFAVSIILAMLISGCTQSSFTPGYFQSARVYEIDITSSDTISNVTIYVPLPVNHEKPMLGPSELTEQTFRKDNFSVDIIQAIPQGLVINKPIPEKENYSWYLKVTAMQISRENNFHIILGNPRSVSSPYSFVETRFPFGNESVFLPKIDFTIPSPANLTLSPVTWDFDSATEKVTQKVPIFVEYSAPSSARVEIFSDIAGDNTWKEQDDESFGNSYDDEFDWTNTGEAHGWQIASGTFTAAKGSYPNFSSPVWQAVIQANTTEG